MYSGGPFPYAAFVLPIAYITNKLVVISEKPYRLYITNKLWRPRSYFGRLAVFGFHAFENKLWSCSKNITVWRSMPKALLTVVRH